MQRMVDTMASPGYNAPQQTRVADPLNITGGSQNRRNELGSIGLGVDRHDRHMQKGCIRSRHSQRPCRQQ